MSHINLKELGMLYINSADLERNINNLIEFSHFVDEGWGWGKRTYSFND